MTRMRKGSWNLWISRPQSFEGKGHFPLHGNKRPRLRILASLGILSVLVTGVCFSAEVVEFNFEGPDPSRSADGKYKSWKNSADGAASPEYSSERAREGTSSFRANVKRADRYTNNPAANGYRMEMGGFYPNDNFEVNKGSATEDYWFGFSIFIPSPYPVVKTRWFFEVAFQIHHRPPPGVSLANYIGGSPSMALELQPETKTTGRFRLITRGSNLPYSQQVKNDVYKTSDSFIYNYETDRWIDIVINTRLSSNGGGFTKVWVDGELRHDFKGMTYYAERGNAIAMTGIYNGWKDTPQTDPDPVRERTYFIDALRFSKGSWGGSYSDVAPRAMSIRAPDGVRIVNP